MLNVQSTLALPVSRQASTTSFAPSNLSHCACPWPVWLHLGAWQGRLVWVLLLIGPTWLLDKPFFQLEIHERKYFLLGDLRDTMRQFGEPVTIAWILIVAWAIDPSRRRPLIVALVVTLVASGIASGTKILVGRERPKVSRGETVFAGPRWPGTMVPDPSFPSGHTTAAFAFAHALCRILPKQRRIWLILAAGCGASRATSEAHYLTDVLVGAWLGWEIARYCWESSVGSRLLARLDRRMPPEPWLPPWDWTLNKAAAAK